MWEKMKKLKTIITIEIKYALAPVCGVDLFIERGNSYQKVFTILIKESDFPHTHFNRNIFSYIILKPLKFYILKKS